MRQSNRLSIQKLYIDIWTLGLIYEIDIDGSTVDIKMTFTSAGCPAGAQLVEQVRNEVNALEGVEKTNVDVVFQPPWQPSEELKALMGLA